MEKLPVGCMNYHEKDSVGWLTFPSFEELPFVRHAFSTRLGGVSTVSYTHLIAVAGGPEGQFPASFCPPCGVCRQALAEFCSPDFEVLLVQSEEKTECYTLGELLPLAFTPASLNGEGGTADENV